MPAPTSAGWPAVAAPPPFPGDAIHVWFAPVDSARAAALAPLLNAEEQQRATAFHFPADRERYTIGRGALRQLLGTYLDRPAAALAFSAGPAGKPALAFAATAPASARTLQFNVSHSGSAVLLAFARQAAVGVDVESQRPNVEFVDLATRFFAPDEAALVRAAAPAVRATVFYAIWTRKEACVKAVGAGLGIDLRSFSVAPLDATPRALRIQDGPTARSLQVQPLPPLPAHATALAVESDHPLPVSCFALAP